MWSKVWFQSLLRYLRGLDFRLWALELPASLSSLRSLLHAWLETGSLCFFIADVFQVWWTLSLELPPLVRPLRGMLRWLWIVEWRRNLWLWLLWSLWLPQMLPCPSHPLSSLQMLQTAQGQLSVPLPVSLCRDSFGWVVIRRVAIQSWMSLFEPASVHLVKKLETICLVGDRFPKGPTNLLCSTLTLWSSAVAQVDFLELQQTWGYQLLRC